VAGQLAEPPPPRVSLRVVLDTLLRPGDRWPVQVETAAPSQVTVMLAPLLPETPALNIESQQGAGLRTFWPLRGQTGTRIVPGAYRLIVNAQDSSGPPTTLVRVLVVERVTPDTEPHPPSLDRMAFLPETTHHTTRKAGFLIVSAIGAAGLATTVTVADRGASPVTLLVPGALTVGGLIGFLKGRPAPQLNTANVAHNRRLVDMDAAERRRIAAANAQAVADAAMRVRVVDRP
jgi:hypothetical protein